MLSFFTLGEKVDAISHTDDEIRRLDDVISKARNDSKPRIGTGTAFVTFLKRGYAADCCRIFGDARKSNKEMDAPSIGVRGQLCRNPGLWHVAMAAKPEDVHWRNLRYSNFQQIMFTGLGFILLLIVLTFVVTPLFFMQIFISLEKLTSEGAHDVLGGVRGYQGYITSRGAGAGDRWYKYTSELLTPLSILFINTIFMPYLVHWAVKHFGHRTLSHMKRTSFSFIFFFMLVNLLFIPALSLSSLDEFLYISKVIPIDQVLAQVVLYGSAGVFFINYTAQAALLGCSFYFVFHTTSPTLVNWASGGSVRSCMRVRVCVLMRVCALVRVQLLHQ